MDIYITDWIQEDYNESDKTEESIMSSTGSIHSIKENTDEYLIRAFGRLDDGSSVCLDIKNFKPYFYIYIPQNFNKNHIFIFIENIKTKIHKSIRNQLIDYEVVLKKPFTEYTGDDLFYFLKLSFSTLNAFKKYDYVFRKEHKILGLNSNEAFMYDRYETNLSPLLRFIHNNDLKSIGWSTMDKTKMQINYDNIHNTTHYYSISHEYLKLSERTDIPNIRTLSFDIEADSSHADFPIADKDYMKLAREISTEYIRLRQECKIKTPKECEPILLKYIQLAFNTDYNNSGVSYFGANIDVKRFNFSINIDELYEYIYIDNIKEYLIKLYNFNNDEEIVKLQPIFEKMGIELTTEINRLTAQNNVRFKTHKRNVIVLILRLMFDPDYTGCNLNNVYTLDNKKPDAKTYQQIIKKVVIICNNIYQSIINKTKQNEELLEELNNLFNDNFPQVCGDQVIQIGSVFKKFNEKDPYLKHIITLNNSNKFTNIDLIKDENKDILLSVNDISKELGIESSLIKTDIEYYNNLALEKRIENQIKTDKADVIIIECETEEELILEWIKVVLQQDPDIILGYNIFDFDYKYLYNRAKILGIDKEFNNLGKTKWTEKREIGCGGIKKKNEELTVFKIQGLNSSAFGDNTLFYLQMFGRVSIDMYKLAQISFKLDSYKLDSVCKIYLGKSKNDLLPTEIFIKQKGTDEDRAIIAKYCIQDCILVQRLYDKLDIYIAYCGMAQVCSILYSYLFLRGQGIKLLSFVCKICSKNNYLIKVLEKTELDELEKYEGAIVLNPLKNIYFEPIAVADFNSLYPSCMISHNLSHDSYLGFKIINVGEDYTKLRGIVFNPKNKYEVKLLNGEYEGWDYLDVMYDIYNEKPIIKKGKEMKKTEKVVIGHKVCRFAQPPNGQKSIIPNILKYLLDARKDTRKKQEKYKKGDFEWNVLEGLQLAYKTTANSLYGQIGSPTSAIRLIEISACTTAVGRGQIIFSRDFCHKNYAKSVVVYGDTDSIFIKFHTTDIFGNKLVGLDAVFKSMSLCMEAAAEITLNLKRPHNLDFEKAIFPFMLISKKRYHGHYYTKPNDAGFYANSMGIVLKRRDNAKIVKHIFGGMTNIIMKEYNMNMAIEFVKNECSKLLKGEFNLDNFIITKTLRSYYKDPTRIAHNVLAQRIGKRDPGSKPRSNDRIPYAYIVNEDKNALQGERIETPEFIKKNNIKIDYLLYLTNQVQKPVMQIIDLKLSNSKEFFDNIILNYNNDKLGIKRIPIKVIIRPNVIFKNCNSGYKAYIESDSDSSEYDSDDN